MKTEQDSKTMKADMNMPDMTWLIRLSEKDYARLKTRYEDFVNFTFKVLMKQAVKIQMLGDDDELSSEFTEQIANELIEEGAFSKKTAEALKKEMAEKRY